MSYGLIAQESIWFRTVCRQNGIDLTDEQITKLEEFARLLLDWNKKINLISRRDEENLWNAHLLHSVSILFKLRLPLEVSIIDIGTGGGLPGVPLKILRPDLVITFLDSTQKKVNVVQDMLRSLSLKKASTIWGRAEELGKHRDHHACYDVVVARAVAPLKDLVRWSKPFLRTARGRGGERSGRARQMVHVVPPALIALKGGNLEDEVRSVRDAPGVRSIKTIDLTLAGSDQFEDSDKKIVLVEYEQTATTTSWSQP
jgi:16S rRNA (guanine527-N7)-methyltransferase